MPNYPKRVWTMRPAAHEARRLNPYPLDRRAQMKLFEVYIDGGYVGDIRAADLQEAREAAIKFYNIQQDQKVMVCAKPAPAPGTPQ